MPAIIDQTKNLSKALVDPIHDAVTTTVTTRVGQSANLPVQLFYATWFDVTNFPDPSDDPKVEIVRLPNAVAGDVWSGVVRGQLGTIASTKNTVGATYVLMAGIPDQMFKDLQDMIQNSVVAAGQTTGTSTAYDLTLDPVPQALIEGMMIRVRFHIANTSISPTLDLNGTGARTIRDQIGLQIPSGMFQALTTQLLILRGTTWRVLAVPMSTSDQLNNVWDHATEDGTSTGSAYVLNYDRSPGADFDNTEGSIIHFKAVNANAAGATVAITTVGSQKAIKKFGGAAVEVDDINIGDSVLLQKNVANGDWYLMSAGAPLSITGHSSVPAATGDEVLIADVSASNTQKKVTAGSIANLPRSDFISAYDTNTQSVVLANTFQDILFTNNGEIDGWTHTPGAADFVCPTTGKYRVTFTAHATKTTGSNSIVEIIALFNGTEVAGSQGGGLSTVNNVPISASGSFILDAVATQILKFQLAGETTDSEIVPLGGTAVTSPSMVVAITKL